MNRIGVVLGVATLGTAALAAELTFIGDENASWTAPSSYQEERVPSAGDTVTIAKECVGVVNDSNFDFVASLGKIVLNEKGELRFDVTGEKDFPVPAACYTTKSRTERSQIVKNGSGILSLSGGKGDGAAYRADLVVNEGNLKLYPNETSGLPSLEFNSLTVASGATLTLPPCPMWTRINGQTISVAGTIHCPFEGKPDDTNGPLLLTRDTVGEISGRLTGNMIYRGGDYQTCSTVSLTGTNNTIYGILAYSYAQGMTTIGFTTYGNTNGAPSSIGTTSPAIVGTAPGRLLYLGDGETTKKSLNWGSTVSGCEPATFDAGAHGGFTFEEPGEWFFTSSSRMNHDIIVTGSNAVECCWNGRFNEAVSAQDEKLSTYIIKRGTGTWHFGHNIRKWNQGVIAVEDGKLKFDTILPAGKCCSLGQSSRLRGRVSLGEGDTVVPYAFLLGGEAGSNPVFEYSGTAAASCDTRPIGVKADATFANGTDFNFAFTNVFGVGDGAKTLTLAGDSTTAVNTLTTVTNACGTLSIAKDGEGTWTLKGVQDVNGEIFVKKGTLVLEKEPAHYTWFRVNIPQTYMNYCVNPNSPGYGVAETAKTGRTSTYASCVNFQEFALYDVEGNRLNLNLTTGTSAEYGVWTSELEENSAAMVNGSVDSPDNGRILAEMFNDRVSNSTGAALANYRSQYQNQGYPQWAVSFVMRLSDGVAEPVSFDWANVFIWPTSGRNAWYIPYALTIDASADGVNWTTINTQFTTADTKQWSYDTCDAMLAPTTTVANAWVSDNTLVSSTTGQKRALKDGKGYALNAKTPTGGHTFERVTGYSVDAGATLKADCKGNATLTIKGLTVDPAKGAGTIDGFAFAETGTFNLTSLPPGGSKYKFTLLNCTGFENVADWDVLLNGQETGKYEIGVAADGTVTVVRKGLTVIIK